MLFPVYWMINVSLTPQRDMRKDPPDLLPLHPTFSGYRASSTTSCRTWARACSSALGTVLVTLVLAAPAGYALAKLRPRGGGLLNCSCWSPR